MLSLELFRPRQLKAALFELLCMSASSLSRIPTWQQGRVAIQVSDGHWVL